MKPLVESNIANIPWYMKSEYEYVDDWFLLGSPFHSVAIVLVYLVFILKLGPTLMENREPYKLKKPLVIYNMIQVLLSLYMFLIGSQFIYEYGLVDTKCVLNDLSLQKLLMAKFYVYFIAKVLELMDTVFFVLRKKTKQITFLHVYHHCLMMLSTFAMLKYTPTYSIVFLGTINSLVHVFMYAYYGLSAFPSMEKYLWWKKYLTSFQLIQFMLIFIHVAVSSFVSKCPPSYFLLCNILFNALLLIYLFGDFYFKSYVNKKDENSSNVFRNNAIHENGIVKPMSGVTRRHVKNES